MANKKKEVEEVKVEVVEKKDLPVPTISKEGRTLLNRIKKNIEMVGAKCKAVCKDMANIDDSENKFVIKELGISKATLSQMKSAGRIYNNFPCLEGLTHTNIVELAPLFKEGYKKEVLDEFTACVFTESVEADERIKKLETLTQRELREAVKDYINPNQIENNGKDDEEEEGEGDGEGTGSKVAPTETDSFKELVELLKKYKVTKKDIEVVTGLVEKIVNEVK